ncbi:transposase [Anaeromyxobacter dehalogenans 2CP-1]|uniref:Transposase n=1 Tax=Anaeromyxobacter dehalogenans (strain ATCC BAA-258 / DSM 21875 / 2CP-1) TaxID=455488 RepID=B8JF88_ANAD2|nr:transposase [Anaeromyxobacter dehalogenans]ACL64445.1 transposase [Anaeromyxobacter dehalogenans 2CP-1]
MARIPRFALVERDSSNHCTWRAHDFERVLEEAGATDKFLELLGRYKEKYGIEINSYCLMGTHPHVTCTTRRDQEQFSRFWQVVNGQFARWYNRRRDRRGQVVMERMRSPRIQAEGAHQLTVMRYGDLNPVRAGLVRSPKDWKWSSYRHYAFGEPDPLIDDAPEYLALGKTGPQRRKAYQALFALPLSESLRTRRIDLVEYPFVGDAHWVMHRLDVAGLSPPD